VASKALETQTRSRAEKVEANLAAGVATLSGEQIKREALESAVSNLSASLESARAKINALEDVSMQQAALIGKYESEISFLKSNEQYNIEKLSSISLQSSESENFLVSLIQRGSDVLSEITHSVQSVVQIEDLFSVLDSLPVQPSDSRKSECDIFLFQLRKLCISFKSLDEAFGELFETIGSEYDFIEYDLNRSAQHQGLSSSRLSDMSDDSLTVVDGTRKEDSRTGGGEAERVLSNSIDGIRTKVLKLCKQYAFARQREIEKNQFEKKLDEVSTNLLSVSKNIFEFFSVPNLTRSCFRSK
jgi:hypothetical protein